MKKKPFLTLKQKQKIADEWIKHNGAADFDLKSRDIYLYDGGLFSVHKETKIVSKTRMVHKKDPVGKLYTVHFIPIKRNGRILKEKRDDYSVTFWFEELGETINYLKRMEKMLNSIGYKTRYKIR